MNGDWPQWLVTSMHEDDGQCYPDYAAQSAAVSQASVISPLTAFSLIRVNGEDARDFLQGQFSSDVRELDGSRAQYSSYSTAKGRMLASFLVWKAQSDYFLLLSSDIAPAFVKRLSMFIMRSRVRAQLHTEAVLLGGHGAETESWLAERGVMPPSAPLTLAEDTRGIQCIRLPSRALLLVWPENQLALLGATLPASLTLVGAEAWSLLDIAAGIPWVTQSTQEQFVPQMANMDAIGAISFTKGCYPGQEIIARTRYLGKVKRRMERVRLPCAAHNGDALYSPGVPEQSIGHLVNVARDMDGNYLALAVAQTPCWSEGIYLDKDNIHRLEKLSLPYTVSDE